MGANPAIAAEIARLRERAADHREYINLAISRGQAPQGAEIAGFNAAQAQIKALEKRLYS